MAFVILSWVSLLAVYSASGVPDSYKANNEIKADRDATLWVFVEIDASIKTSDINNPIPQAKFSALHWYFTNLFSVFPQDYEFKVIYQQCLNLSESLSHHTSNNYWSLLSSFMSNCYSPFSDILSQINSKYTVIPTAKASPSNGSAPLTVTFDARWSIDPSNETVPSANFYWYYRDVDNIDKIIWNWPVVNYTFDEPGNYLVHLTVRSSNKVSQWIFDWEKTISIDVTPKTAIISLYVNWQRMTDFNKVKLWTQEAERWVVFDASATIPMWWRQLISHLWKITSRDWFSYVKEWNWEPWIIRVSLPGQGEFNVSLTTLDNETNNVTETYSLVVSDPVAIIKKTPEEWNTSTTFSFDSSASYSVLSKLRLYTWEIFNQDWEKIEVYQWKSIKQKFKEPWVYTVKLMVEDEQAQSNFDTVQIYVESTEPVPQFEIKQTNEWKFPSRFVLDASISSDVDKANWFDALTYEWTFPEALRVNILESENDNEKLVVEFDGVWTYPIWLTISDKYGKISKIEKEITIDSTIRPEIEISPVATYRWQEINFTVKSNEAILNYQRDFGDWDKRIVQVANISHVYKKTWVYRVTLSVDAANGNKNEVSSFVFVGEKDFPVAWYVIKWLKQFIRTQDEVCTDVDGSINAAYQIDRYSDVTIDPSLSVNSKWEKSDLSFYFQPGGGEIYNQSVFRYKFDELWCKFVDFTVEDTSIWRNNKVRIWFKVVNALPTLENVLLFFPQYGNEMWVWFNENHVKDIFNDDFDPLIVKVSASNIYDPDWNISYLKRYYYYKDDPTRIIETKITPWDITYTFFSLPKLAWEFMFWVMMYDNDDGKQSSENVIWNGPVVFFPPDSSKPDVPLVTLKANQSTVEIWDEVEFNVVSKIISDRPDFIKERTIYYDFNGDGDWDLVTKKDRVTHVFEEPSDDSLWYTPRASVLYRWYRWVTNGWKIIVKNWLKPKLLYDKYGKLVIYRDISFGDIKDKKFCLNMRDCGEDKVITWWSAYSFEYDDYDKYFVSLDVSDKYANSASKKLAIILDEDEISTWEDFHMLSIPKLSNNWDNLDLFVGKSLDNAILYYISYDNARGECYVDTDIEYDSDVDGVLDNDHDFSCNQLHLQQYKANYEWVVGRIYYSRDDLTLISKDFNVSFLDFEVDLPSEMKVVYDDISSLLNNFDWVEWSSWVNKTFVILLTDLRDWLDDSNTTKANVVQVSDYLENNEVALTEDYKKRLDLILAGLSDSSVIAAQWWSDYQRSKAEILSVLPTTLAMDVSELFVDFESVVSDESLGVSQQTKRKESLQKVVNAINWAVALDGQAQDNQIDKIDMDTIIMPNICIIMQFYNIPTSLCSSEDIKAVPDDLLVEKGKSSSNLLKIILIVLGVLVAIFVVVVVIFAVRAKMAQARDEELGEEAELPQEPTPVVEKPAETK